jgi:hypothetical protein
MTTGAGERTTTLADHPRDAVGHGSLHDGATVFRLDDVLCSLGVGVDDGRHVCSSRFGILQT